MKHFNSKRIYFSKEETELLIDELIENEYLYENLEGHIKKLSNSNLNSFKKLKRNAIKNLAKKIGISVERSKCLTIKIKNIANICSKNPRSFVLFKKTRELFHLYLKTKNSNSESCHKIKQKLEKRKSQIFEMIFNSKKKNFVWEDTSDHSNDDYFREIRDQKDQKAETETEDVNPTERIFDSFFKAKILENESLIFDNNYEDSLDELRFPSDTEEMIFKKNYLRFRKNLIDRTSLLFSLERRNDVIFLINYLDDIVKNTRYESKAICISFKHLFDSLDLVVKEMEKQEKDLKSFMQKTTDLFAIFLSKNKIV